MKTYAQLSADGVCFAELETHEDSDGPQGQNIIETDGMGKIGQRYEDGKWVPVVPTVAEQVVKDLSRIDAATGMGRAMREALIAIGDKVGADVSFLRTKEAEAATLRGRLKA